jgi:site-specific DNA recombinase
MRAALYVRVSTIDKQDYTRQIEELTTVAKKDGYSDDCIDVYPDKISGYTKNIMRPELSNMLSNLEKYNVIYVTEISRLGRKPSEVRRVIDQISDLKIPIYIHQYKQRTINNDGRDNIVLSIILNVLIDIGNQEAETFKERSKSGLLSAVRKGHAGGGATLAYGYHRGDNKMLIVNPIEAETVKLIFKMYSEGIGSKKISNHLNLNKVPTKLQNTSVSKVLNYKNYTKNVDEIKWGDKQVQEILANSIYKGERKYKDIIVEIDPIVTPELFDECTQIRKTKTHRNYLTTYDYLLKDLLVCGRCGRNFFGRYKPKQSGDKVYICSSRLKNGSNCGNFGVNITYLESVIYHLLIPSRFLLKYIQNKDLLKDSVILKLRNMENDLILESSALERIEKSSDLLLDIYLSGRLTKEKYEKRQAKIDCEFENTSKNIVLLRSSITDNKRLIKKLSTVDSDADFIDKITSNRKELIVIFKQFISKIILTNLDQKNLLVDLHLSIENVESKNSIKLLLDLSIPKRKTNLNYTYWLHYKKLRIESRDNNVVLTSPESILESFDELDDPQFHYTIGTHEVLRLI